MRRIFWLAMGVTIGVLVVRKLQEAAQAVTPEALAHRTGRAAAGFGEQVRLFVSDVRVGMREREAELREGVGLDVHEPAPEIIDPTTGKDR